MPIKPRSHAELMRLADPSRHGRRVYDGAYRAARNDAVRHPIEARVEAIRRSTRWRRLRVVVLSAEPLCRDCAIYGDVTPAVDVDHIVPLVELIVRGEPTRAYERANLQPLCRSCHNRKTATERRTVLGIGSDASEAKSNGSNQSHAAGAP